MTWSLNEIESLAKKAARGAGLDWGLAEEAGKTTRCWVIAALIWLYSAVLLDLIAWSV